MAKFKTLPNYELTRPELHVQFDSSGNFETSDEFEIKYLESLAPFIERVDKPKSEPKAPAKTSAKSK
ncbi:hypothetical protein GJU41_11995 [Bacillus idriensis]|uniref:Uncharacterized protein n=1 Tax=Metabacillus idriensis TaxID=324768 RepID=A0A6I2M8Q0_9BACI|nr:hypothetical protein [Metabacillus idriensis]MRX54695.1 hypothetical protein [Metabacillus idriensis]